MDTHANLQQPAFDMGAGHPSSDPQVFDPLSHLLSPLLNDGILWFFFFSVVRGCYIFLHMYFHQVLLGSVRGLPLMNKKFQYLDIP